MLWNALRLRNDRQASKEEVQDRIEQLKTLECNRLVVYVVSRSVTPARNFGCAWWGCQTSHADPGLMQVQAKWAAIWAISCNSLRWLSERECHPYHCCDLGGPYGGMKTQISKSSSFYLPPYASKTPLVWGMAVKNQVCRLCQSRKPTPSSTDSSCKSKCSLVAASHCPLRE